MNNYKLNKAYKKYYLSKVKKHFLIKWGWYLRVLIFIGVLSVVADRVNVWYFKPSKLYTLLDRFFYDYAKEHPEVLTRTKAFKWPYITNESESKLNDVSTFQVEYDSLYVQKEYEFLDRYDLKNMTPQERLSAQTFRYLIEQEILEKLLFKNTKYPIDHISGIQVQLPLLMLNCHTIKDISDAKNYISRLIDAQDKIAELIAGNRLNPAEEYADITTKNILYRRQGETLEECIHHFHINEGLTIPPKSVLKRVREQLHIFLEGGVENNVFYKDFMSKLDHVDNDELINNRSELKYEIKKAIEGSVIPSFDALYRTVAELEMQAPEEITSLQYPLGEMYYQHSLRNKLGMSDSHLDFKHRPKKLYFLGKNLLYRETAKLHQMLSEIGAGSGSLRTKIDSLYTGENHITHTEYLKQFEETLLQSSTLFTPHEKVEFTHFPPSISTTFFEPFYYEGSYDKSRCGKIYFSDSVSFYSKLVLKPTAIGFSALNQWSSLRVKNTSLPYFRRGLTFRYIEEFWKNAFLYYHYADAPLEEKVKYQLWKVHNLVFMVCDLGIHHYLWTKKEAMEYVFEKSILTEREAENMVDFCSSSIGEGVARGFGMHLFESYIVKEEKGGDIQYVMSELKPLFNEGAVSFSEFDKLIFANNSENRMK
ncbi:DUF885 family protein [Flammeovirga aprica]|uniref:DUF885 domain-containing protein n=1 Tax=Flammeovirga aprica JL-4 TaxID=694437 RepID=A0A7X9RTY9_9BACT|nr:DUF885 family protein [Flammeovirga aprica]NME68314.1 DUF885 domain-containing protein [Flammeovirga aprica JL-4]